MSYDCFCDYDRPSFYRSSINRARKAHKCYECGSDIFPGEQYEYVSGRWEYFDTFKTCADCVDIRTWTKNNVPCLCWAHGNLLEDCREAVNEAADRAPQETVGLRFGLLRRLLLKERKSKQKTPA